MLNVGAVPESYIVRVKNAENPLILEKKSILHFMNLLSLHTFRGLPSSRGLHSKGSSLYPNRTSLGLQLTAENPLVLVKKFILYFTKIMCVNTCGGLPSSYL